MIVGEEWIYRLKESAPSERVRVLAIHPKKTSSRADVEFLDETGRIENVPGVRLRRPWSEVAAYDKLMANWDRIDSDLTEVESAAVSEVFDHLVDAAIATCEWSPVRYATAIYDAYGLTQLLGQQVDDVLRGVAWFDLNGIRMASPEGTLLIAASICAEHPAEVIAWVMAEEAVIRDKCKRGGRVQSLSGKVDASTSPEWEYEWYLKYEKPRHEILRQWCGYREVTFHERLAAAEAETRRLDILVARLIDNARHKGEEHWADIIEREHSGDRITPHRVRAVVDRPLRPHEIPVREVPSRRRWGY